MGPHLLKRLHNEVAFIHPGMRNNQLRQIYLRITIQQYVNVYDAVGILAINGLVRTPHLSFYGLGLLKQVQWGQCRINPHHSVDKRAVALKAPRLSFDKSGLTLNMSNPLLYLINSSPQMQTLITEVRPQSKINFH